MAAGKRPAAALDAFCKRLRVGSTDEYEDATSLGEGAFGCVCKARHRRTKETVAIKFLCSDTEEAPDEAELLREAHLLETCSDDNPFVAAFRGMARDPSTGDLCLVMEYAGQSLQHLLRERRSLPEAAVRDVMSQLLTGATKMHRRRVVHRDIKPANVLIDESGQRAKLCDLGLAISLSEPQPYSKAGTLSYMAPEMLLGKADYDALVDSWSLGCVMAELLTGKELFAPGDDDTDAKEPSKDRELIEQLKTIFSVLGMPDHKTWPGFSALPLAVDVFYSSPLKQRDSLGELFTEEVLSDDGFEVLEGLLTCNPDKRLTAAAALKRPWFAAPRTTAAAAKVDATVWLMKKVTPVPTKNVLKIPRAVWSAQTV